MKKVEAVPMDCLVCDCPYCGKEIVETNGDLRDMTTFDMELEGELDCSHCGKSFEYYINEE